MPWRMSRVEALGFGVWGVGCRVVKVVGFWVWGSGV